MVVKAMTTEPLPGRVTEDKDRSPFGLGWEYARRDWSEDPPEFLEPRHHEAFRRGYAAYCCLDQAIDKAMLKGISRKGG
jgi:hypothetical protein